MGVLLAGPRHEEVFHWIFRSSGGMHASEDVQVVIGVYAAD